MGKLKEKFESAILNKIVKKAEKMEKAFSKHEDKEEVAPKPARDKARTPWFAKKADVQGPLHPSLQGIQNFIDSNERAAERHLAVAKSK